MGRGTGAGYGGGAGGAGGLGVGRGGAREARTVVAGIGTGLLHVFWRLSYS